MFPKPQPGSPWAPIPVSEVILDTVRALVVGLDTDGKVRLFNDACVELTGWPRADALGVDWLTNFVPAPARDRVLDILHRLLEGHGGSTDEGPILTRARGERLIQWRNAVARNEHGHIVLVVGTGLDVTDLRRTTREHALLAELNANVLAGMPFPRALAPALAELTSLSGFEILTIERYWPETDELELVAVHAPAGAVLPTGLKIARDQSLSGVVVRSGEPLSEPAAQRRPEHRHPALRALGVQTFLCYPIKSDDRVLGALILASRAAPPLLPTIRDYLPRVADALALVMTRLDAVAQLGESEMRARAVLDAAADGIITIDGQGTVESFNPAAERIFGVRADQVIGRNVTVLMPPAYVGEHEDYLARYLITGKPPIIGTLREIVGRRSDGTEFPLDLAISETRLPTGRRLFTGIVRDLTDRKNLEAQLRQAQKMEAVGQLAGGVAHDFNNVLTGITGYTQLALRKIGPDDPLHRYIDEIQRAAFRATNLTRQLLAFSRQQALSPHVLDLGTLVGDLGTMLRRLIGEDIELRVDAPAGCAYVKADPGQIEQIIVNLAVNARDAMPAGGTLRIAVTTGEGEEDTARVHRAVPPGRYAMLSAADTGSGMTDDVRAHIFEPFFTTKEPGRGTGLGLATVFGIVTQSGGHIRVETAPDRGSTFRVYLPRVAAPDAAIARGSSGIALPVGNETILLVEDEEVVRQVNTEQLRLQGYRVLPASNSEEALRLSRAHAGGIDLLVTDVVMPGLNGHDLAAVLKLSQPRLKVLFVSGYPASVVLSQRGGMTDVPFLSKPLTPGALARKVREVIDGE